MAGVVVGAGDGSPWPVPQADGAVKEFQAKITGDSVYPTGGTVILPGAVGLAAIYGITVGLSTDGTVQAVWDGANQKLKCFSTNAAPMVEVANTTNLSTKVFPAVIRGV